MFLCVCVCVCVCVRARAWVRACFEEVNYVIFLSAIYRILRLKKRSSVGIHLSADNLHKEAMTTTTKNLNDFHHVQMTMNVKTIFSFPITIFI